MTGKKNKGRSGRSGKNRRQRVIPFVARAPNVSRVNLCYSGNFSLSETAAGLGAFRVFRLNSIYDPDLTGIGSSAAGLSQLQSMFSNYRVHAARVRLEAIYYNTGGGDNAGIIGFAPLANQSVLPANPVTWRMLPQAQHKLVVSAGAGGHNRIDASAMVDLARLARIRKMQYLMDMDYSSPTQANPLRPLNLFVFVNTVNGNGIANSQFVITIAYDVEFFNPLPLTTN